MVSHHKMAAEWLYHWAATLKINRHDDDDDDDADRKPDVQKINQTRLFFPTNYFISLFPIYKYSFDFYNLCHSLATVGSVFKSIRHRGTRGMVERLTDTTQAWHRERGRYCIYCCQPESTERLSLHHCCWCHPVICGCAERECWELGGLSAVDLKETRGRQLELLKSNLTFKAIGQDILHEATSGLLIIR